MEIEQCRQLILDSIKPYSDVEWVHITKAYGHIAGCDIVSDMNVPPYPRSAMDGYAIKALDVNGASYDNPIRLKVIGQMLAGDYKEYVYEQCTAIRIMTGAYIPLGYDCVIRQEDTDYGEDYVNIYTTAIPYNNYCKEGEDIKKADILIKAGTKLNSTCIGMLASVGIESVCVRRGVRVAIISTGTEIMSVGEKLTKGKIFNSIAYMLNGAIMYNGMQVTSISTCIDDEGLLKENILTALKENDVIITTGAVSVGKKDIIPKVLLDMGARVLFHGANIQPGTPTMASILEDKVILSLSGNPYAAMANFELYFWSIAGKLMGTDAFEPEIKDAILVSEYNKVNKNRRLIRANYVDGKVMLPTKVHASSVISNMMECNCFIDLEENRKVQVGDKVRVRIIRSN